MMALYQEIEYALNRFKLPRSGSLAYRFCQNADVECGCNYHQQSCLINRTISWHFGEPYMARGKKPSQNASWQVEFVRFELSSDDKKQLTAWVNKNKDHFDDLLTEIVQGGNKVNFSFNEQNDSFICSVTGKEDSGVNAKRCYTSHGKSWLMAAWVALYKFHVIWKGALWESVEDGEDFG